MPIKKRPRIAPTDNWQQLSLLVEGPEQHAYEVMRTCVLFGQSPAERATPGRTPTHSPAEALGWVHGIYRTEEDR
jgi:hypothetical protein